MSDLPLVTFAGEDEASMCARMLVHYNNDISTEFVV